MSRETLMAVIQHDFANPALLDQALTHSSWVNERRGKRLEHNERLEFLGDAVLNAAIAMLLYERFPKHTEGELSRLRSRLVNGDTLAEIATSLELGPNLRLGKGEDASGGRTRGAVLEDALEAVLGAVYADAGFEPCVPIVRRLFLARIDAFGTGVQRHWKSPRSHLQELIQKRHKAVPTYVIVAQDGPDHAPTYVAEVRLGDRRLGTGKASTKKDAYARAAEAALDAHDTE